MAVQFSNYAYSYTRNGKPVFAPSVLGRKIGKDIKSQVEDNYVFDEFVYHLSASGGHVAALHAHRAHKFFARVDLANFFYSIARNRVQRALADIGVGRARHYAKWSCVKNPMGEPSYALPYGFLQSPILATLVLMKSSVGGYLRTINQGGLVSVSIYVDDISLSSDDREALEEAFNILREKIVESNFSVSQGKVRAPSDKMDIFNCDLSTGKAVVSQARIDEFRSIARPPLSVLGFEGYCDSVAKGNRP